jgi:hypothetical protein
VGLPKGVICLLCPVRVSGLTRPGPAQGIWIAVTTFVPTFLVTVFGIPYLAGLPVASRSPADLHGGTPATMASRGPDRGFGGVPPNEMPREMGAMRPVGLADAPAWWASTPIELSLGNAPVPATPSAIPRPAARPTPSPIEPKAAEPHRSAPPVTKDDTWARGPAFLNQDAAARFAARMQRVGFPTYVRREDRRGTRWVVWIGNPD